MADPIMPLKASLGQITHTEINDLVESVKSKQDKQTGKALSANDFTTAEKNKLSVLDGTADSAKPVSTAQAAAMITSADARIAVQKGAANGIASLDGNGLVPAVQLPSYVDDVLEGANLAAFPATGASGKIYIALDTGKTYRWSGSAYVEIVSSPGSTDSVTEGATNQYFTAARVRSTILTGLSAAVSRVLPVATDTLLVAWGKVVKYLSELSTVAFSGAASDITEDANNRFVSDTEKTTWNAKADGINGAFKVLTYGAPTNYPKDAAQPNGQVTLTGNTTINPTGYVDGDGGLLKIIRGSGGSEVITLPNDTGSEVANQMATGAGKVIVLSWFLDGSTYRWKVEIGAIAPSGTAPAIASQAEAEAGTDNAKMMTPLRVAQAIEELAPTNTGGAPLVNNLNQSTAGTHALDGKQGKVIERRHRLKTGPNISVSGFSIPTEGLSDGTETGHTYQQTQNPNFNSINNVFTFVNYYFNTTTPAERIGTNDITIKVSVSNGTSTRLLTFNGLTSITIKPGMAVKSDPFPHFFIVGTPVVIKTFVSVATMGMTWPVGDVTTAHGAGDMTTSGSLTTAVISGYGPIKVEGIATSVQAKVPVVINGDSLIAGGGDGIAMGWLRRGLDAQNIPWQRVAVGSALVSSFVQPAGGYALSQLLPHSTIITDLGGATLIDSGFTTLAQVKAVLTPWWETLIHNDADLWITTFTPFGSATTAQKNLRATVNDDLRTLPASTTYLRPDGRPIITGVLDVGAACETSLNSGVWKSGYTSDGIHITSQGNSTIVGTTVITSAHFNRY